MVDDWSQGVQEAHASAQKAITPVPKCPELQRGLDVRDDDDSPY